MKRVFGQVEIIFDVGYLVSAFIMGISFFISPTSIRLLAGIMALLLVFGDMFHLVPRIQVIRTQDEERFRPALGRGKQITSISMTIFYLLLWQIGLYLSDSQVASVWTILLYGLAAVRILLCFFSQNGWLDRYPPVRWGILRNIPFGLMGILVAGFFFFSRHQFPHMYFMWLAILLSFAFYVPVVLFANRNPKIGMLMLPKTCCYLFIIGMCLYL